MPTRKLLAVFALVTLAACAADGPSVEKPQDAAALDPAQEAWWAHLQNLCGLAFVGAMAHGDETDTDFAGLPMVMHVRRCSADRIEVPFHVGEDHSRTWVLTRTPNGLQLQHDHRHEDGTPHEANMYGGHTDAPGTETAQFFPVDEYSKELFVNHGWPQSVTNVWSMEIVPGSRFSYVLRRADRHFQVDFDLSSNIEPPPAPWGHE
jgi:hypothetical protein